MLWFAETVLTLMRNPEYCVYGAAKVDNEGNLDSGEDRFNQVLESVVLQLSAAGRQSHDRSSDKFVAFASALSRSSSVHPPGP
jgi:uncharacterized membrane protein